MGNKQHQQLVELSSPHPFFKKAEIITDKSNKLIRSTIHCDSDSYTKWKNNLNKNQDLLKNSNFLLVPQKHDFSKQGLCSHGGNATVNFQYFPYLLSEQISSRQLKQQKFRQSDLWYLLYSLAGAKSQAKQLTCQKVGDIKPENVFIDNEGQVKVGCIYSFPLEQSNYRKAMNQQSTLLAPQDIDKLQQGLTDNQQNKQSEIYSIGLTVIAAGVLQTPSNIYNLSKFTFDHGAASIFINKWKLSQNYSDIFKAIVSNLVELNPNDRLTPHQLWTFVSQYQQNIKSKEKFVISSVPAKVQRQFAQLQSFIRNHRH